MWIKTSVDNTDCYIGVLYHPPKPIYNTAELLLLLEETMDVINNNNSATHENPIVILAGDFNKIDSTLILNTELQAAMLRLRTKVITWTVYIHRSRYMTILK